MRRSSQFEDLLRDGITAAKDGNRRLAQSLLNQAAMLDPTDGRPYLWLSSTTDDPQEQRDFLEQAVARDPGNAAARRGLALLTGKIDPGKLTQPGAKLPERNGVEQVEAQASSFKCPKCGGNMSAALLTGLLTCDYCGYEKVADAQQASDGMGQVMDFVMPTTLAHGWAQGQQAVSCENCGARRILSAGQKAGSCAYCGSNQLIRSNEAGDLIDPHLIAPMAVDEKRVAQLVKEWLGRGFFTPDNLNVGSQSLRLRPAYYSAWMFDGTVEIKWSCEVAEGSGGSKNWRAVNGAEYEFFKEILAPGVKALQPGQLSSIEPFDLVNTQEFNPEYLAGWPTMIYDRSLADASLLAREKVLRQLRPQMYSRVEPGREKRNLRLGSGNWSDMTFKHVLLPIWIGNYRFEGKAYQVLINGQTGKVGGEKPHDHVKMALTFALIAIVVILLAAGAWYLLSGGL